MSERYYAVAKSYMLYRQKHLEDREVRDKLRFLIDYCNASNAASGSKYDANANVENKNMATLIGELPKSNFIRLNRRMLADRLKEMYGKEVADRYIDLLNSHYIYKNDETSLANYCASITMYPWLIGGTTSIGGNSKAPTNLKSFCGGFINMVFMVSSMLRAPVLHRNFQAVFWNISYYDRYYFESLFDNFVFPDGDRPSSCCRLRSEIQDNGFSYTLGAGGVSTGSKSVLTINLNRCIQHVAREGVHYQFFLEEIINLVHKVQLAYNENLEYMYEKGMLPLFTAGYINMNRQYLTIGVNGLVEAAEFLGIAINDNPKYAEFVQQILGLVETCNKRYRRFYRIEKGKMVDRINSFHKKI
jgi:hypothetical protein